MKTRILIFTTIIALATSCTSKKEQPLEGKVKRETVSIASKVPGRIIEIRVNEADMVKAGDTLAIIDIPEVEAKLKQAQGVLLSAKSQYQMSLNGATKEQLRQAVAGYEAAKEQFSFASKSLERVKNMYQDSLIPDQKYDETMAKYNGAKAQLEAAEAKKEEVMKGARDEKIKMAEGQMIRAEGALQEAQTAYKEKFVIAPKDMQVETITLHEGELALPGYNLFVGYDLTELYFRFTVKESLLSRFKNGEEHSITLPFENKNVNSKLIAIKQLAKYADRTSSYPNYEIGESVYELKCVPLNLKETNDLFNNCTVILNLN